MDELAQAGFARYLIDPDVEYRFAAVKKHNEIDLVSC